MKNLKKIFALALALCMVLCFAACGSEDGIKIGVQTTTTGDIYASGDFGEDAVIRYDNGALAVEALKNGKVDCVIIDNEPAKSFVAANSGLKILETEYAVE
ncbi:MAG: transporter substrate-binding domain-containing protein, partial [Clostridia bacterium]|nr:transporter substrate-binding domain-containing protein [Clostridia bacterium]